MTDYSHLKKIGKFCGTLKAAKELQIARQAARKTNDPLEDTIYGRLAKARKAIPLGSTSTSEVEALVYHDNPRKKNWRETKSEVSQNGPYCREINCGRYSSRCTYTHWEYQPAVGCYGIPCRARLLFSYAGKKTILMAPVGYKWATDANGILLVSNDGKKDYHPDSDDLRNYRKAALRDKALKNHETRQQLKKQAKEDAAAVRLAEKEGAMTCLADSIKAGNCKAGTINFATRHNLNPADHIKPTELLKIANGQAHRVRLAVAISLRRHRREMTQGFCLLDEHTAQ